jgi:hypothetical protein
MVMPDETWTPEGRAVWDFYRNLKYSPRPSYDTFAADRCACGHLVYVDDVGHCQVIGCIGCEDHKSRNLPAGGAE